MNLWSARLTIVRTTATTVDSLCSMRIDTLLVKVASRCNINCTYCYVYNMGDDGWRDMPALISRETITALAHAIKEFVTQQTEAFATVLHGGEPLMMGTRRLDVLLTALRDSLPRHYPISIQTNGMLLTREIVDLCSRHKVSVSVSLDGPKPVNDRFRLGKRGESTHDRVVAGVEVLRRHPDSEFLYSGLLSVIDPDSDPNVIYGYFKSLGAPSIDFLYRDGNHSNMPYGKESFESVEYGEWLGRLLDIYLADPNPPRIRFLDDIIKLCLGGRGIKEGLGDAEYGIAIVETDGTISKNDTLKSSFNGADKFSEAWSVKASKFKDVFQSAEFKLYHELQRPTSLTCKKCPYIHICGGGMPLHRWKSGADYDNPSVYCNDQKTLISKVASRLRIEGLKIDPRIAA